MKRFRGEVLKRSKDARCLKITEKSLIQHYELHIELIKNVKNGQFWRVFENLKFAVKQC